MYSNGGGDGWITIVSISLGSTAAVSRAMSVWRIKDVNVHFATKQEGFVL